MTKIGYAVVDTETTGLLTAYRHRIVEIAIIQLDSAGRVTDEWTTLVNPDRDLGPQAIHGIRAAEIRRAPSFAQIAGDVVERLRGRVVVAHNWSFDAMHLRAEFERMGMETPLWADAGLCTMRAASRVIPSASRSLVDCCTAIGLTGLAWHTARDDAMAAAALLSHMLAFSPAAVRITAEHKKAAGWAWPQMVRAAVPPVRRLPADHVEPHFLARMVERLPRDEEPVVDAYFAVLDQVLLDRQISVTEADSLIKVAEQFGLGRTDAIGVHHTYLRELARAAWVDDVVTAEERADIDAVAALLGIEADTARHTIDEARAARSPARVTVGGLVLRPGDKIVLTGTMHRDREDIQQQAAAAGLRVTSAVSRRTTVVVAADPDSLSGKAKDARTLGVPVVGEDAFLRVLSAM
ncbi:exonuclease domain-containing protein [Actinocrispum wychmicini]|uniref:DNA polymerase-3 subunit epsilon n=1 Tax=Actinocrispum wychmicini TaxID=1213861 RepID=A0A4R2J3P7_9PSEU|nr:exonuclease domain-containing protein [Actinocrispum wychmicini]TCO52654.1 DNA polymerase-3 subunit epsilon [Actinocrispum wychmicini]